MPVNTIFVNGKEYFFRNPEDCQKYFRCIDGKLVLHACAGGLFWQPLEQRCDWLANVNCQNRDCKCKILYKNSKTLSHLSTASIQFSFQFFPDKINVKKATKRIVVVFCAGV
jgi:hypothetical protein